MCRAVAFSFGLATTLAVLGVVSTYLGKAYGQIGSGLPTAVSLIAIVMGLNLLEAVQLPLPSLDVDVRNLSMSPLVTVRLFLLASFSHVSGMCTHNLRFLKVHDDLLSRPWCSGSGCSSTGRDCVNGGSLEEAEIVALVACSWPGACWFVSAVCPHDIARDANT